MKREVHKLKHEAAKHLSGVSKKVKEFGAEAHKHVMGHLKEHATKLAGHVIDKGADAAAAVAKEHIKGQDANIEKVKELGKEKVKGALKKAVPGMGKKMKN